MSMFSRRRDVDQLLKTFNHNFVERDVFLFTASDLSSSMSVFSIIGNLETSNISV